LKCRLFILREVVRWRRTVDSGILGKSPIVRTEGHDSASKTCRIRGSISSKGVGRSWIGHSDQNDVNKYHLANMPLCFRRIRLRGRLPPAQQRSQALSSLCGEGISPHTSARFRSVILKGYCERTFVAPPVWFDSFEAPDDVSWLDNRKT
jgi:hypothetical protein